MLTTHKPCALRGPDGLAVLGQTLHQLRGIRYEGGEGGAAPAAPAAPAGGAPAEPAPAAPAGGAPAAPAEPAAPAKVPDSEQPDIGGVKFTDLPKETQEEVRRLRSLDARARDEKAALEAKLAEGLTPEQRKELGKLLGYEKDEAPDAAALSAQINTVTTRAETAEATVADLTRENMTLRLAPEAGANADRLLDSKGFEKVLKGLDPAKPAEFKTAIEAWVKDHPADAATPGQRVAPSSGGQRPTGAVPARSSSGTLEGAIAGAMSQQQPAR